VANGLTQPLTRTRFLSQLELESQGLAGGIRSLAGPSGLPPGRIGQGEQGLPTDFLVAASGRTEQAWLAPATA
jgi:hypothetical protein